MDGLTPRRTAGLHGVARCFLHRPFGTLPPFSARRDGSERLGTADGTPEGQLHQRQRAHLPPRSTRAKGKGRVRPVKSTEMLPLNLNMLIDEMLLDFTVDLTRTNVIIKYVNHLKPS